MTINTKVLLVNPPSEFKNPVLPLGMASIAAYLKQQDAELKISVIDAWAEDLSFEELEKRVAETQADLIGIYMLSPRYDKAKAAIEACRRALPKATIIAGGPHPSALPQETLREIPQLDICVIGEGEVTMHELIKGHPLPDINGIAYREGGEIKTTRPREFIKNMDELPFPARELFPLQKYKSPPPYGRENPHFIMITSRGCPFQCTYCCKNVFEDNYRARSPKNVCDEIQELISKYGAREILFTDDDFTLNMKRAEEICDEILKRRLKFRWACLTRFDLVTEELLRKMKKAGCWMIAYGLESGNQEILDSVKKGFTIEQAISAVKMTKSAGISTFCSFVVGLPNETKETIRDTNNLIKKVKPDFISGTILIVYPGSRLFRLIMEGKYAGKLKALNKGENMPGVFFKGNYTTLENNLTYEELIRAVKEIERGFYFRPEYIWQSIKNIRSFSDLSYYLSAGFMIIKSFIK